jgi:hypothetical protein
MASTKKSEDAEKRSTTKCVCGKQILLVPNVKLMGKAIESHVDKHKKRLRIQQKQRLWLKV